MADEKQKEGLSVTTERVKEISLPAAALAVDVNPAATKAFAACQDGGIYEVDITAGKPELLGRHESYASGVALIPGTSTLVSAGYDGELQWHDVDARKSVRKVKAHDFWSWDMDVSPDGSVVATVTGRYDAGSYKYEPAPEREPSLKLFDAKTGELRHKLPHVPSVQAVAISADSKYVAAGNIMGEVRVWEIATGKLVNQWTTPDLTSWGIIKSHHYLGGVFAMTFAPQPDELYVCGFGPMRDPMAGNGVQRWQRFNWRTGKKLDETHEGESGAGLMETIAFHPSGRFFVMAGRLVQGKWNMAVFDTASGKNLYSIDAKHRVTEARFTSDGKHLLLAKAKGQEKRNKEGRWPDYGLLEVRSVTVS